MIYIHIHGDETIIIAKFLLNQDNTNIAKTQHESEIEHTNALIRILLSCSDVNLYSKNTGTEFGAIKTVTTFIYDAINMM